MKIKAAWRYRLRRWHKKYGKEEKNSGYDTVKIME